MIQYDNAQIGEVVTHFVGNRLLEDGMTDFLGVASCRDEYSNTKRVIKLDNNVRIYITGSRDQVVQGEDEYGKFYKVYYEEESI